MLTPTTYCALLDTLVGQPHVGTTDPTHLPGFRSSSRQDSGQGSGSGSD